MFASARPFNATTGIDNNATASTTIVRLSTGWSFRKSQFRVTRLPSLPFRREAVQFTEKLSLLLRVEGFNLLNHETSRGAA
jgi:hypothetical protein